MISTIDATSDPGSWRREMRMRSDYRYWLEAEHERLLAENLELRMRIAEVVAFCSQGGADGEPYDTVMRLVNGEQEFLIRRK